MLLLISDSKQQPPTAVKKQAVCKSAFFSCTARVFNTWFLQCWRTSPLSCRATNFILIMTPYRSVENMPRLTNKDAKPGVPHNFLAAIGRSHAPMATNDVSLM